MMTLDEYKQKVRDNIAAAQKNLDVHMLVGQGYVCALGNGDMAISSDRDSFRLWPVTGHLTKITHMTSDAALRVSNAWNAIPEVVRSGLTVEPIHYRDLLECNIVIWNNMLTALEECDDEI